MSERLSFALVLLVGIASVAGMVFLSGTSATGDVVSVRTFIPGGSFIPGRNFIPAGRAIALPAYVPCSDVNCPQHQPAFALQNPDGTVVLSSEGKPVCICIPPQTE